MNRAMLAAVAPLLLAMSTEAGAEAGALPQPRPLIVLDPGHGGSNTGAVGPALTEKSFTLGLALLVEQELVRAGVAVELTRRDDRTLTLRQRSDLANRLGASLFVSLHGNASLSKSQRGFEAFVLTAEAVEGIAPALRSDGTSFRAGVSGQVATMLDDIERGATQWEAAELAVSVQRELRAARGSAGDRGVRQDAHHVLLGATMPAILVEAGFVDHAAEGRELAQPATQRALAQAISRAILEHVQ